LILNQKGQPQAKNLRPPTSSPNLDLHYQTPGTAYPDPSVASHQPGRRDGRGPDAGAVCIGLIKDIGKNHAFITCDDVKELYGMDTYCPAEVAFGFRRGDEVEFDLMLKEGKPQAKNPRRPTASSAAVQDLGMALLQQSPADPVTADAPRSRIYANAINAGSVFNGVIKDIGKNHAFIICPDVEELHGMDTYCPAILALGFSRGEEVEFDLMLKNGKPQAKNLRRPNGGIASSEDTLQAPGEAAFSGTIIEIGKKMAFIENPEIKAQYGNEVFHPSHLLTGYNAGDVVDFDLTVNAKGQPQARNVRRSGGGPKARYSPY